MRFLKNMISVLPVFCVVNGVTAATTARPSVMSASVRRMPTMTINARGNSTSTTATTTTTTTTTTGTLATAECVDAYTSCLKADDVCGADFEECTNNTLFYAQKSKCASTLMQCSSAGITTLFGASNTAAFANKDSNDKYIYPTAASTLGQLIDGAFIKNRYSTSQCAKKYTTCLKKDDVCGADFELCTSNTEFKKQKLFCESTLARCESDGIRELFGTADSTTNPSATSRLGIMISEGASLAAVNAVSTCYKVADQCILNACSKNPYKCKEGISANLASSAENTSSSEGSASTNTDDSILNRANVSGFIKNACFDTIGANKFCYATFVGNGAMPTASQLRDEDNQSDVFGEAYSSRMNDSMKSKIDDLIEKFDKKSKQRCQDTITSCAMRTCGGGSGAACYSLAFDESSTDTVGVTRESVKKEIKLGCSAVVESDTYCKYVLATMDNTTGTLDYGDENTMFDRLFASDSDPVGAVAALNAKLSTSYNASALATMKKQCQAVATSCVKTMCGQNYENCYRNRTDIYSNLTNTGDSGFDKSMNKVGGVLDYTIVLGLCINTVKDSSACTEHLNVAKARFSAGHNDVSVWGGKDSVRDGWVDAGAAKSVTVDTTTVQEVNENGENMCICPNGDKEPCNTVKSNGDVCSEPSKISYDNYITTQSANTLFRELVTDIEYEAQAKYNAKLTREQNMCLSSNNGGIIGNRDNGSTYMWVKLKSNKTPKDYSVNGLKTNQFIASNDLYGSFCRIRITLQSEDAKIQDFLKGQDWNNAYFAVGDAFTCGSWIPNDKLEDLAKKVADEQTADKTAANKKLRGWLTFAGAIAGATGGGIAMDKMQMSNGTLGKVLNKNLSVANNADEIVKTINSARTEYAKFESATDGTVKNTAARSAVNYANNALTAARNIGITGIDTLRFSVTTSGDAISIGNVAHKQKFKWKKADLNKVDAELKKLKSCNALNEQVKGIREVMASVPTDSNSTKEIDFTGLKAIYDNDVNCQTTDDDNNKIDITGGKITLHAEDAGWDGSAIDNSTSDFLNDLALLEEKCLNYQNGKRADGSGQRLGLDAAGAAVGGLAGGLLVNRLTNDIQDANLTAEQKKIKEEWMNSVGNKIHCFIGADEVGTYGEMLGTSLE